MVQLSDIKSKPVLWHEDSGRRPWENGRRVPAAGHLMERHNPPGSVSGRKLGEASHRLIASSLQLKADQNGFSNNKQGAPPSYLTAPYIPLVNSYVIYGLHNQGQPRMVPPEQDYSSAGYPLSQNPPLNPPNAQGSYHYPINNQAAANNLHYPQRHHQNGGSRHIPRPMAQMSTEAGPYPSHPSVYNGKRRYNTRSSSSCQQWGGRMAPQGNQNVSGGYCLHQQGGFNQFVHRGNDHQQQGGNHLHHHQRGDYEQRGSQPQRSKQQYQHGSNQQRRGNQQQRGNPYSALDRKGSRRHLAPPVEDIH